MFELPHPIVFLQAAFILFLLLDRFLNKINKTSLLHVIKNWWSLFEDKFYVYKYYKVPQFDPNMQENQLYRIIQTYVFYSLPDVEDSNSIRLFSDNECDINGMLAPNYSVVDHFLSAKFVWIHENGDNNDNCFVLKMKKNEKRLLIPYVGHIHARYNEIRSKNEEVRLFVNVDDKTENNRRWRSVPLSHPATMETVVMDVDLKKSVKRDLELFLNAKHYYHSLGRVWKRSYLLRGESGTGKSTFITAMAKFLRYDVYYIDLYKVLDDSDLWKILIQISKKSVIVIEDLDRWLSENRRSTNVSLSGLLNFMDGILTCCGEERVMVFTMNGNDQIDPMVLRHGRIDAHIHFPLCDFNAFKTLASTHLGVEDHKLFPHVEEMFQAGASLSPAEIGEIMISERRSPTRALLSVIRSLQSKFEAMKASKSQGPQSKVETRKTSTSQGPRLSGSGSVRVEEKCGESGEASKSQGPRLSGSRPVHVEEECGESGSYWLEDPSKLQSLFRTESTGKVSFDCDERHGS